MELQLSDVHNIRGKPEGEAREKGQYLLSSTIDAEWVNETSCLLQNKKKKLLRA